MSPDHFDDGNGRETRKTDGGPRYKYGRLGIKEKKTPGESYIHPVDSRRDGYWQTDSSYSY